ncbi:hypothetical protein RRG08_019251 [Elysia crispata]|uniref:Uncharacterized protein n=1 Tax=Elysia crispata TaxID=231223 RepID=A0AAE1E0Z1_9GAST|nr:hypothetical protein RRG08_019251 [Elysia crispata]
MKLVFLGVVLAVLTAAAAPRSSPLEDIGRALHRVSKFLARIPAKRVCQGYMCAYSHSSSSASKEAVHKVLMHYLYHCALNKDCSQGKRRRRSSEPVARNTMTLRKLTQYKTPSG